MERGKRVTVRGEDYVVLSKTGTSGEGSKFFGKYVFILRKLSDRTVWRAFGKTVSHNSRLSQVIEPGTDVCGIPNKANYHINVIIGREGETSYSDIYVCDEHMPAELTEWDEGTINPQEFPYSWEKMVQPVRTLFKFDDADKWDVLEFKVSKLR